MDDATAIGSDHRVVSLDGHLPLPEGDRDIGVSCVPDANDIHTSPGLVNGGLRRCLQWKNATEATAAEDTKEGTTEVNAERNTVVPSRNACPALEDTLLRLGLGACEAPGRVNLRGEVGSEDRVEGTRVVVCMQRELRALHDAVNGACINAQAVVVVRVDGDESWIGLEGYAVEQQAFFVPSHDDWLVTLHMLLDQLEEFCAGESVKGLVVLDG